MYAYFSNNILFTNLEHFKHIQKTQNEEHNEKYNLFQIVKIVSTFVEQFSFYRDYLTKYNVLYGKQI